MASGATGYLIYKAKLDFVEISNLKSRYIDSERYELEEELEKEKPQESIKRL